MNRYTLILTFLLSLVSLPVWSIDYKDLQERDGIIYKKTSGVPFTGAFTGENQGYVKNGKLEGEVILFNENGTILATSNYKNGKIHGVEIFYHKNGRLSAINNYRDGELEGESIAYYDNGQLRRKGVWKNTKLEGYWEFYNKDGSIRENSGTYKNGKKISD